MHAHESLICTTPVCIRGSLRYGEESPCSYPVLEAPTEHHSGTSKHADQPWYEDCTSVGPNERVADELCQWMPDTKPHTDVNVDVKF